MLAFAERELAELAGAIRVAGRHEEPQLLDRLTKLAGQVESQYAGTHSRFSASSAYFELVDRRIADIGRVIMPVKHANALRVNGQRVQRHQT